MNLRLKSVNVAGFRAFAELRTVRFAPQLTVVYGANGCGKTSLLDAVAWLFNGDISRYQEYGNEWSRHRRSHTRSLFHNDIEPAVECTFQCIPDLTLVRLSRTESERARADIPIASWANAKTAQKGRCGKDLLWAHMLQQSTMLRLAAARGSHRLEELAPLLDLTDSEARISGLTSSIRTLTQAKCRLERELAQVPPGDESSLLLDRLSDVAEDIHARLVLLDVKAGDIPISGSLDLDGIQAWTSWIDQCLLEATLSAQRLTLRANDLRSTYSDEAAQITPVRTGVRTVEDLTLEINRTAESLDQAVREARQVSESHAQTQAAVLELRTAIGGLEEAEAAFTAAESDMRASEITITEMQELALRDSALREEVADIGGSMRQHQLRVASLKRELGSIGRIIRELEHLAVRKAESERQRNESEAWLAENDERMRLSYGALPELESRYARLSEESASVAELVRDVREARNLLQHHMQSSECPLCGHSYEVHDVLVNAVEAQTKLWDRRFSELSEDMSSTSLALLSVHQMQADEARYTSRKHECIAALEQIGIDIRTAEESLRMRCKGSGLWDQAFDTTIAEQDWDKLWRDTQSRASIVLKDHARLLEALTSQRGRAERELQSVEETVSSGNARNAEVKVRIANCESSVAASRERLTRAVDAARALLGMESSHDVAGLLDDAQQHASGLEAGARMAQQLVRGIQTDMSSAKYALSRALDARCENLKVEINRLLGLKGSLKEAIEMSELLGRRKSIQDSISQVDEKIELNKMARHKWRCTLRKETREAIGPIAHRVSAAFAYLSESSMWNGIEAEPVEPDGREKTGLIFRPLTDKQSKTGSTALVKGANATFSLNQGHLSVLGLSIFLAIFADREHRRIAEGPYLDTIILDDPVQSLDSLRDDALACLLTDIARASQVIVSTSDIRFASHLMLASRALWKASPNSCNVVQLSDMTDVGPIVTNYGAEEWIRRQRIYLPA